MKDLFGISDDNSSPQPHHYKNRSTSLLVRFLSASLFRRYSFTKGLDFRVPLAYVMIYNAIEAMESRIQDNNERRLFGNNVINAKLWAELLARRYTDERKTTDAHRRIGYCLPITHVERMKYNEENKDLTV